jgi:SAM-dependent methyltransferase
MILSAKENAPWARYIMDDILNLDIRKYDCFDLVLSTFTLHHIQNDMQQIAIQNMIGLSCPKGSVLIIDRSFRDRPERDAKEKMLIEKGDQEALDIFHSEFYPIVEDVVRLVRGLGRQVEAFPVEENIWGYRIY